MSEIFDMSPFTYVGENKHYKDLTPEEIEELKKNKPESDVKLEALPSSEEVKESSASVVGQMLPQIELVDIEEPSLDDLFADIDEESELLKEALEDVIAGADMYFESAGFIDTIKNKLFKNKFIFAKTIKTMFYQTLSEVQQNNL